MKTITIAGRLGKDAELRDTKSGSVCKFSVAVDSRRGGEKSTTWFNVSIFGKRGEALRQHLTKGASVCIVGDLDVRTYEKDGEIRIDLGVVASEVALLGGGQRSPAGRSGGNYDRPPPRTDEDDFGGDPDIPF